MKKQTLYSFTITALVLFFGSLTVLAQSQENLVTVQVPFSFQISEKQFPAGQYVIRCDPQTRRLQLFQRDKQNILESIYTIPHFLSKEPVQTSLIFKEYGDKRFLSELRILGREDGYALIRSSAERRLAESEEARITRAVRSDRGQTTEQHN